MAKQTNGKRTVVHAETFVREWQKAETLEAFCQETGMEPKSARTRSWQLRKTYGIPLKQLTGGHGRPSLDCDALKKLAKSLA